MWYLRGEWNKKHSTRTAVLLSFFRRPLNKRWELWIWRPKTLKNCWLRSEFAFIWNFKASSLTIQVRSAYQSSDDVVQKFFSKDVELRTTVGRESFSVWDLSRNIQVANHAISNQKLLLEEKCIKYKSKSLLDDYLKRIAENVAAFERYFVWSLSYQINLFDVCVTQCTHTFHLLYIWIVVPPC